MIGATSTFSPGDLREVLAVIVQGVLIPAVTAGQAVVMEGARAICPVDTGELRDSIQSEDPSDEGGVVVGLVTASAPHAAFVEFGTGQRGAASDGTAPGGYSTTWPGMVAQPYLRPALDSARGVVLEGFQK